MLARVLKALEAREAAIEAGDHVEDIKTFFKTATAKGYNAGDVSQLLVDAQHGICAYCADSGVEASFYDIEHFRPRSTYWWLTWTWENLWISCNTCQAKSATFELDAEDQLQAPAHPLDYASFQTWIEQPMLLDPAIDDPQDHIQFVYRDRHWIWEPLSPRGKHTLDLLRLSFSRQTQDEDSAAQAARHDRQRAHERYQAHIQRELAPRRKRIDDNIAVEHIHYAAEEWDEVVYSFLQSDTLHSQKAWWYFKHHHELGQWEQHGLIMPDYPDDNPDAPHQHQITLTMRDDYPQWLRDDPALVLELHLALNQRPVTQLHNTIKALCRRQPLDLATLARLLDREPSTIQEHMRKLHISPDADNLYSITDAPAHDD